MDAVKKTVKNVGIEAAKTAYKSVVQKHRWFDWKQNNW